MYHTYNWKGRKHKRTFVQHHTSIYDIDSEPSVKIAAEVKSHANVNKTNRGEGGGNMSQK